jgi:hypothetical protein
MLTFIKNILICQGGGSKTASKPSTQTRSVQPTQQRPQQQQQRPPPQQQQQPPAPVQQSGGSGMLGTIASVAAGSMIGNVMADKFLNSGSGDGMNLVQKERRVESNLTS